MLEELLLEQEEGRAQADAAGEVVVDEDVGFEILDRDDGALLARARPGRDVTGRQGFAGRVVADGDPDVVDVAH